jgi:hypothetical protein
MCIQPALLFDTMRGIQEDQTQSRYHSVHGAQFPGLSYSPSSIWSFQPIVTQAVDVIQGYLRCWPRETWAQCSCQWGFTWLTRLENKYSVL